MAAISARRWLTWLALLLALVAILGAFVFLQLRALQVEQLDEDLWVLRGVGGNTAVWRTEEGAVVVDSMTFPMQGERIQARARALTGTDVIMLINTHYHLDHTHGNPGFEPDIRVIATQRTLSHLTTIDAEFWQGDAAQRLPNETFADSTRLRVGNKHLLLLHPGRGHTDGDLVVVFEQSKVVHMGDLFFHKHYPNIDLEAGGSVQRWPATLDRVLDLDFERVIPGHGATTDRAGLEGFRQFMVELGAIGRAAAQSGASLEDTLKTTELRADAGYAPIRFIGVTLGLDREFVLRRAWEESTGNFTLANAP